MTRRTHDLLREPRTSEEEACLERAESCHHRWSHYPDNPTRARPRPYCLICGIDIDNRLSVVWQHGHMGGVVH